MSKAFLSYDMRSDFSYPVYVGRSLETNANNDGIDVKDINYEDKVSGLLYRENNRTFLELSKHPVKDGIDTDIISETDYIQNEKDGGIWYVSAWNEKINFVLRKYVCISWKQNLSNTSLSLATSKWEIFDYSIVNQFMLNDKISQAEIYLDGINNWFNITHPNQKYNTVPQIEYWNLRYKNANFSLELHGTMNEYSTGKTYEKVMGMSLIIRFFNAQDRLYVYELSARIRNLLQILMDESIGINQIILNTVHGPEEGFSDERENWMVSQSFLPNINQIRNKSRYEWDIPFDTIQLKFGQILKKYTQDENLQRLIDNYLLVSQFKVPISTAIVTLVSGVETYYKDARYSNGKKIKNAEEKLRKFINLIDNPSEFVKERFNFPMFSTEKMILKMKDSRDFFVHGDKTEKFTSDYDLIDDYLAFKSLMRQSILYLLRVEPFDESVKYLV